MGRVPEPLRLTLGANNIYLLRDGSDALLVDAGPDYAGAWEALIAQLGQHGITPADVRQVVLTHYHRDHAGLAARWQAEGARIIGGRDDAPQLLHQPADRQLLRERAAAVLAHNGVAREQAWWSIPAREGAGDHRAADGHGAWPGQLRITPLAPDVLVDGGDCITLGGRLLTVTACPGHTPGSILLQDERGGDVFTGDHLLPQQVATVGIQFRDRERWPSMPPFVRSLEQTRALAGRRALPGHGEPVADTGDAASWSLRYIERRLTRIQRRLAGGPATAYEIVQALFPRHQPEHLVTLMTEVIGLLDLLHERGQARTVDDEPPLQWAST